MLVDGEEIRGEEDGDGSIGWEVGVGSGIVIGLTWAIAMLRIPKKKQELTAMLTAK